MAKSSSQKRRLVCQANLQVEAYEYAPASPPPEKGRPSELTPFILQGRWDEGAQPVQKQMLDEFMEKYGLQDQDWRKQLKPKE